MKLSKLRDVLEKWSEAYGDPEIAVEVIYKGGIYEYDLYLNKISLNEYFDASWLGPGTIIGIQATGRCTCAQKLRLPCPQKHHDGTHD